MPRDADELVELLDLETIDDNLFRGAQMPTTRPVVFGGQVAAQALVAASRTVAAPYAVGVAPSSGASTANPWLWAVTSTLPVVRSITGWLMPRWP